MVYLLPYIDYAPLHSQWQFAGNSGYLNTNNNALATGLEIAVYSCPASPLPHFKATQQGNAVAFLGNYVGVSGAIDGLGFTESRTNWMNGGGIISGGGIMFPNAQLHMNQVADGTSNTIAFSEHSGFIKDNTGALKDWRATQPWGWYLGVKHPGKPPNFLAPTATHDNRAPGMATIRYPIGYTPASGWVNDIPNTGVGIGSFTANCTGAKYPAELDACRRRRQCRVLRRHRALSRRHHTAQHARGPGDAR